MATTIEVPTWLMTFVTEVSSHITTFTPLGSSFGQDVNGDWWVELAPVEEVDPEGKRHFEGFELSLLPVIELFEASALAYACEDGLGFEGLFAGQWVSLVVQNKPINPAEVSRLDALMGISTVTLAEAN